MFSLPLILIYTPTLGPRHCPWHSWRRQSKSYGTSAECRHDVETHGPRGTCQSHWECDTWNNPRRKGNVIVLKSKYLFHKVIGSSLEVGFVAACQYHDCGRCFLTKHVKIFQLFPSCQETSHLYCNVSRYCKHRHLHLHFLLLTIFRGCLTTTLTLSLTLTVTLTRPAERGHWGQIAPGPRTLRGLRL